MVLVRVMVLVLVRVMVKVMVLVRVMVLVKVMVLIRVMVLVKVMVLVRVMVLVWVMDLVTVMVPVLAGVMARVMVTVRVLVRVMVKVMALVKVMVIVLARVLVLARIKVMVLVKVMDKVMVLVRVMVLLKVMVRIKEASLVDTFVEEVYAHEANCLLHDSLIRGMDEASDAVPGTLFSCNMLVDCSCDDVCDWQHAFGKRHTFAFVSSQKESLLAWDNLREVGVPYSVLASFPKITTTLGNCGGFCTIYGCRAAKYSSSILGPTWCFIFKMHDSGATHDTAAVNLCRPA